VGGGWSIVGSDEVGLDDELEALVFRDRILFRGVELIAAP
jgi:hypothetical protein